MNHKQRMNELLSSLPKTKAQYDNLHRMYAEAENNGNFDGMEQVGQKIEHLEKQVGPYLANEWSRKQRADALDEWINKLDRDHEGEGG